MDGLPKCEVNCSPLTPITFLKRAADFYPNRTSVIYERTRFTWKQTFDRCRRLASSLLSLNVSKNDVVSVLAPNVPALYEMHFAVPMAGAVLNPINTRLDANNIAFILRHAQPKIFFVDCLLLSLAREVLLLLEGDSEAASSPSGDNIPLVVVIDDVDSPTGLRLGELEYEELVGTVNPMSVPFRVEDELDPISLNYTSGTTAAPKGVVYSHRGAYLSTLSLIMGWEMGTGPTYLWTLPMFHCNGWTFTWGVAARGGTNVCIRHVTAREIYRNIESHGVTHMCCAPTVFNILLEGGGPQRTRGSRPVRILTGGAPPPAALLEKIQQLGFIVTHAYGLTEATGPALVCEWADEWNRLPQSEQTRLKARQGIGVLTLDEVDVMNKKTFESVPRDGKTMGEIVLKGSSIMKGYFKNPKATSEAFKHGWLNTGDIGVIHPDGYIEIKDRSKDIIISGGENISSVEVDTVLYKHPRVLEAAVVAMPHPRWGESPCAFVVLKNGANGNEKDVGEAEIIEYCRENLPHFMAPKKVVLLPELPKNNGKILKSKLREIAKSFVVPDEMNSSKKVPRHEKKHPVDRIVLAMSRL